MKKQLVTAISIALMAATSGAAVAAEPDDHHEGERKHRFHRGMHDAGDPQAMIRHLGKSLELDPTQKQEIENVLTAAKPELDALREREKANRQAMRELDVSNSNYDTEVGNLAAEKGAIASEQALLHGRIKSDIHQLLTPEQRQELARKAQKMRERLQKHNGGGSPG
jgi:Spy/CpxP family protein refolding chaperone